MDLKLPEIVPARVVPSAADAIDRAGAKFKQATDAVGDAMLQSKLADITVQTQEAAVQKASRKVEVLDFIDRNPHVTAETARMMFAGGEVPAGVRLKEPDGSDRLIPMEELSVAYFDQEVGAADELASQQITAPGWRDKFLRATAADTAETRARVQAAATQQKVLNNELRSKLIYDQFMDAKDFTQAEAVLATHAAIRPAELAKMRAEHPARMTEMVVLDRLRSTNIDELDKLVEDLQANEVNPEAGIYEPIPAKDRYDLINRARDRKDSILLAQERAAKAAKEKYEQQIGDKVQYAIEQQRATGEPASKVFDREFGILPRDIDVQFYKDMRGMLDADPKRTTDPAAYGELSRALKDGRLANMPYSTMASYYTRLSPGTWEEWMNRWSAEQKEPGSAKPPLPADADAEIARLTVLAYPEDPDGSANRVLLQQEVYMELAKRARKSGDPGFYQKAKENGTIAALVSDLRLGAKTGRFNQVPVTETATIRGILSRQGASTRATDINAFRAKALEQKSDIEDLWETLGGNDKASGRPLSNEDVFHVYSVVNNPVTKERLRATAQVRLGRAPSDDDILEQAVLGQVPRSTAGARAKLGEEAEKKVAVRQLNAAGEANVKEARRLLDSPEKPAELKAELSRITDLLGTPNPKTGYNYTTADIKQMQEDAALDYARKPKLVPSHRKVE